MNTQNSPSSCGCRKVHPPTATETSSCSCGCGCGKDVGGDLRTANTSGLDSDQKRELARIIIAFVLFVAVFTLAETGMLGTWFGPENALLAEFALFLIPYFVAGYKVLLRAARNIVRGRMFDENFLMAVATIGAFALVLFPESDPHMAEGAAVMLFYQIGEFFEDYAVGKTRASIARMMDIAPDFANIMRDGQLIKVQPDEVPIGSEIVVKPGERVPLDGIVISGSSQLDTAALTGESAPRWVESGSNIMSGCVNMAGALTIRTTKAYDESTVQRILELVENAANKKARTESFITRFARYYTPAVVCFAAALAILPPLVLGGGWADWVQRGLIFLVVSCPCALVISVPLSFFGGIGGASRKGILVKGSNYLEALAHADTVVFDKTGTLTSGNFSVTNVVNAQGEPASANERIALLQTAAYAEVFSDHPIALSVKEAFSNESHSPIDSACVTDAHEESGCGVSAFVNGKHVLVGNDKLMSGHGVLFSTSTETELGSTLLHVAENGAYLGCIALADTPKSDAAQAIADLHASGIKRIVMLTGDLEHAAQSVASKLGISEYRSELLPQDKVTQVETLLAETAERTSEKGKLVFVGDGINDAPVLMRADIGVAMGALGTDAAIEAADIVLMDDKPSRLVTALNIARKTMRIVWQNIYLALGVKFGVLILAALGFANLWLAVFADVGVAVLAILNAMRAMRTKG